MAVLVSWRRGFREPGGLGLGEGGGRAAADEACRCCKVQGTAELYLRQKRLAVPGLDFGFVP